jgi:hypothetical protein
MSSIVHEPVFKLIEFEVDIEQRRARVVIPGVLESSGRPIRSPATGDEHRVRIDIPNGIEFELAEIGSATTKASGAIALQLNDTYGQFSVLRHSGAGVVSARACPMAGARTAAPATAPHLAGTGHIVARCPVLSGLSRDPSPLLSVGPWKPSIVRRTSATWRPPRHGCVVLLCARRSSNPGR